MTTKISAIFGLVIGAALMVSSPRPAAAIIDELLVYPGSNCKVISGGTPTYSSNGTLVNSTGSTLGVQCPMYDNGYDFAGSVWVLDNSTTADVACSSVARNALGSPNGTQLRSTSGNSSDVKQLNFDGPDVTGLFTYRFYNCNLPPGTQLIAYRGRAQ
jgi:hypothetical protein